MKITIAKDQIIAGLQAVQNVVSTRTTLPILSNVLLKAEGGKVEFTATDLDCTVACSVEAKVEKSGRFCWKFSSSQATIFTLCVISTIVFFIIVTALPKHFAINAVLKQMKY